MSRSAILVVLCAIIGVAIAAQAIGPHEPKPEKFQGQKGCYVADLGRVLAFGEKAPSKTKCQEFRCTETNLLYTSCGAVLADPPCKVVTDEKKPFPDCCPKIVCP